MKKEASGLVNIDSLDFRDAEGNFFYEPSTELCLVNNLQQGWFSVVLVPTIENDVYRWHIFAYNSQTKQVESTAIRASEEGLFDVKDYTVFEESNGNLVPRKIPGVIKRSLNISGVTVTNGLAATKYDLQQEQETQSGEKQLIKTTTRLMLAIPTDKGTAAFSFAIAGDGTLSEISNTPSKTIIRSKQREVLLPLNTLDEIKAFSDRTPPPQGIITGLAEGTDAEKAEDLVKISTVAKAADLKNGDLVKITETRDYQGLYRTTKVDNNTFEIDLSSGNGLGYWEKEDKEEGGLIFDGMITAYEKTTDGKLRIICPNHGLGNGDEVQIVGTDVYNDTYPVRKIDDTHFAIERKWATGEAVNVKLISQKRRGIVLDGVDDYVQLPPESMPIGNEITVTFWAKGGNLLPKDNAVIHANGVNNERVFSIHLPWINQNVIFDCGGDASGFDRIEKPAQPTEYKGEWVHWAFTKNAATGEMKIYCNGVLWHSGNGKKKALTKTQTLRLGSFVNNTTFYNGTVSELCIWKVARQEEEIKNSMYLQLTGKEVGLVGYWRLGGISEGKVIDFSVNGNDGTVYGDTYVSAATLKRKVEGGIDAVKYSNPELFAVSNRASYEESFEFKVNSSTPVNLAYLDNADGKGSKIFTLSYWGKSSRSAEEKKPISAEQNKFVDKGNGWYGVSCNVTIPDGVSLLRSFEINKIQGNWDSLEIRKHSIRLLSDSITEAKYTDSVPPLTTLADSHSPLGEKLKELEVKEGQEAVLLKEKRDLEFKLDALSNLRQTQSKVDTLRPIVARLTTEANYLESEYQKQLNNPLNYWCFIQNKQNGLFSKRYPHPMSLGQELVELISSHDSDGTKWKFTDAGGEYYSIQHKQTGLFWVCQTLRHPVLMLTGSFQTAVVSLTSSDGDLTKWKFMDAGEGYYYIQNKTDNRYCEPFAPFALLSISSTLHITLSYSHGSDLTKWSLIKTAEQSNNKISDAYQHWQDKLNELKPQKQQLDALEQVLKNGTTNRDRWQNRLNEVISQLRTIQDNIATLNTEFINGVKNTQQTAQAMPQVAKDNKGLVTQGALLGFVQPASRLNTIETCEGNVQLSYFDTEGRMRQTIYDATADGNNAAFEQWIPDAQRACLNFDKSNSVVTLNNPLSLPPDWTIEAWFLYPLPDTTQWNTLTKGKERGHHIAVKNRKQLGILLDPDPLNPTSNQFYDSGFNMELLSSGWHHIAAVGRGDTTLFYIDGKKVGDTKNVALMPLKAVRDAISDKTSPEYKAADEKYQKMKAAILKLTNDVHAIGNAQPGGQQFGKLAEVRIWGVALSDEEVAVNSKTLLSGNEPGLLAYYPMNEAKETVVRDNTGNKSNDGTISGASWWGCAAPIGNPGNKVMKFDGINDYVSLGNPPALQFANNSYTLEAWIKPSLSSKRGTIISKWNSNVSGWYLFSLQPDQKISIDHNVAPWGVKSSQTIPLETYTHVVATYDGSTVKFYINGQPAGSGQIGQQRDTTTAVLIGAIHNWGNVSEDFFQGQIAEVRIWNKARTQAEIQADMHKRLSGKESNLVAYYPLNEIKLEGSTQKVSDIAGNNHGTVNEAIIVDDNTLPIASDALVSNEYSTIILAPIKGKVATMRRFFAYPVAKGAMLLPDKRIEALELKWIGNAQFAPTLLGYIEGAPPAPSENLSLPDDYNGATSVELTMSEDVAFSWKRSEDSGSGGSFETFIGADTEAYAGFGATAKIALGRAGFKGNIDFSYQSQNESSITSSSSLSLTDKLELRGSPEETPKFPYLGKRFIPKNVGYALVVSALADVFVTKLARSGKMVGYQVQPVDGIPPDVNTITFLINPAYTMNGSLDGMTGSSATSDRFFKHVPEMRSQYGSLYPASYYRLQEAYDLKRQIEAEDKRRESYFSHYNVGLVDELALDRLVGSGDAPPTVGLQREEDKPNTQMTEEEKKKAEEEKLQKEKAEAAEKTKQQQTAAQKKQAEIQSKISNQEKRVQATYSFASWQKRMEDIQIRAGKRNIVNTYVWDADGGLRTEAQSFANTVEHTIGGSFNMIAALGFEGRYGAGGFNAELTAQATVNLTQTMNKTEARSKGFQLNVDLSGLEFRSITNYNDRPIFPGEKVDRYRFMSFYLEGSTQNFQDFFSYVVDPEWLASNDEEARALRQTQAGKPNKTWRLLHRVTYVERPALMGFGQGVRTLKPSSVISDNQILIDKIAELEENIELILKAVQK